VPSAVISGREDREQLTTSEALKAIHDALVSTKNIAAAVCLKEVLHAIGSELDDVACAIGVSDEVWLDAKVLVAISRV